MTPEGRIKQKIKAVLDTYGSDLYYYMPVPTGYGRSSLDYLGFLKGHGFAIEAKEEGKKPTTRQQATIEAIRRSSTDVFIISDTASLAAFNDWCQWIISDRSDIYQPLTSGS